MARDEVGERFRTGTEIGRRIPQIRLLADHADRQAAHAPRLANAGIDERRLEARIGADDEDGVGCLDAFDRRVEQVRGAAERRIEGSAILPAVDIRRAERCHQQLQRIDFLDAGQVAGDRADFVRGARDTALRIAPKASAQLAGCRRPLTLT
jgi:hypothetical protein